MSLLGSLTFPVPYCRRIACELFLCIHLGLAIVYLVSIWNHIWSTSRFPRTYLYVPLGVMSFVSLLHLSIFVCGNMSLWSWMRSHPFMVTSWSPGKQEVLELLVEARHGFTQALQRATALTGSATFRAFVSGPHGTDKSVDQYETVLAVASGFQLLHGYKTSTSRVRRVHLVWQFQTLGGQILETSFYVESSTASKRTFGNHNRAVSYNGIPDYERIISSEASGDFVSRVTNTEEERGRTLYWVGLAFSKCVYHEIVRAYLRRKATMHEVEFQPD
ncbi:NADPH oxidase family protein [Aspergillus novofumigatus IBT 16806]|uniref:Uncharacterized protein n=1 Tax=Aspergillus novofumigatus (strain IBT 16806) TaxID=1392255 RepID=A0A2I1BUB5_ASPN1|nr:uncharacterized protein P174DRAFT_464716 [Aspergillus novofumigatus IBT 16806]PKX88990.1 hypothetical protein P174DRAFT_464716 [Aspergillus novofumigatus IBT 16806]